MPYSRKKMVFLKRPSRETEKKLIFVYSRLCYATKKLIFAGNIFFENCSIEYKNFLRLKKKSKKILWQFQNYWETFLLSPSKNAIYTIFIYGNCMISIFDKKISFLFSTIHRLLCQNKKKFSSELHAVFLTVFFIVNSMK